MKSSIFNAAGNQAYSLPIDAEISFQPVIDRIRRMAEIEKTSKGTFYKAVLQRFEDQGVYDQDIPLDKIHQHESLLELLYACFTPALHTEQQLAWGLSFPFHPMVFYGTELLYDLLAKKKEGQEVYVPEKSSEDFHRERLQLVYTFILKRLYNFEVPVKASLIHAGTNTDTGLLEYYNVNINSDFIDVIAKGELPELDCSALYTHLSAGASYEILEGMLPLDLFRFRGIAMLSVVDITQKMAVENIQRIRLARTPGDDGDTQKNVIHSLKTLVRNNKIEFDLFPFVRVNNEPVYGFAKGGTGVLFAVWGENTLSPKEFSEEAKYYAANPEFFFSPDIFKDPEKEFQNDPYLQQFRDLGVKSLALMPVLQNKVLVGVLGVHTWGEDTFDEKTLALLEPAIGPIAQLLQVYIDEFNMEIDSIVKEKFTAIQPAVQWKFNEAAWHYLQLQKKHLPAKVESILFNDVYPLYGAIDIRNSTLERNTAVKADLGVHLNLLSRMLSGLQEHHRSSLMEETIFNCKKWQHVLAQEALNPTEETNLNFFLTEGTVPYLRHLAHQEPATRPVIEEYMQLIHSGNGVIHEHRQALETSMQMINNAVNNYFETEKHTLQQSYPCYFEKFRTDGIEYDIYIGQSIAPDRPFDHFHLKNLRLWQLSSMAAIAKLTRSLIPQLPRELHTTQLIFAHNHTIDISFRADEKRFDVEGTYNIRYQMIKKRIDKVHIRNSNERLTQPGKIALIYFSRKDVDDYLPYMQYLQESGVLHNDLEELDLEDLQGLSGLKALRVGVV
jgi:GAF domain-containing protein